MRSHFRPLRNYVRQVNNQNSDLAVTSLRGVSIGKEFMPSVANIHGTDLSKYKVVRKGQFAFNPMHVGRDEVLPIGLLLTDDPVIVSPAYVVFEVIDKKELLPDYLMIWCRRSEFDRYAWFTTDSSVRGGFSWSDFRAMALPVPSIDKQWEIVKEYQTIVDRKNLITNLNSKLEEAAKAIFKHWFVDFEFPIPADYAKASRMPKTEGLPYKSNGGAMVFNEALAQEIPKGWEDKTLFDLTSKIGSGATPKGGKESYTQNGIALIRSQNIYDYSFEYEGLAFIDEAQAKQLDNVALEDGDVLLNITGVSVARCCMVSRAALPARVNQHVAIIREKKGFSISHYLMSLLCSTDYKQRLLGNSDAGSTRQALTKAELEKFRVLVPSKDVRELFATKVHAILSYRDSLSRQAHMCNQLLTNLLSMLAIAKA